MFRIQKHAIAILFLSAFLMAVCLSAALPVEPRTIRVGYFAFLGYHELYQSDNGPQGRGYEFDFLQMLRRYTNLNFQYVGYENGWLDMQQMFSDRWMWA